MPNTIKNRPLEPVIAELVSLGLNPQGPTVIAIRDMLTRVDKVLTDKGEVQSKANVTGRSEQLSTTLQNVNATGKLTSTDAIAADGTGSPLTGGKRGFVALDTNNRLANSFRANAVNLACVPTSATVLSNDGVSHSIVIASSTIQFGTSQVSYNAGSVDPGAFGTFYIYADDPTFAGGAVTYQSTTDPTVLVAADGRINFGKITTVGGSAKTGGGNTGGTTTGGTGGRGVNLG